MKSDFRSTTRTFNIHHECKHKNLSDFNASSLFISNILANALQIQQQRFIEESNEDKMRIRKNMLPGLSYIITKANNRDYSGIITANDVKSIPLAKAALNFHSINDNNSFKIILSLFKNAVEFEKTILKIISQKYGISLSDTPFDEI